MSDSSDEDDQRKAESTSRMWVESQPGPSRCQPSRQGYCGYCRVLYSNLDQHLSSLRHLDSVRASSRGSSSVSSASSRRTKLTLLERFLQDVLQHHPHRYNDPRPSHADLPSVSAPPLPREELDELHLSDDNSQSLGTREHLSSSDDTSSQPANQQEEAGTCSQSADGVTDGARQELLSAPIREQEGRETNPAGHTQSSHTHTPPPHTQALPRHAQAPPSVHRKAHRKTDRRKNSDSSNSSPSPWGPGSGPQAPSELRPWLRVGPGPCSGLGPGTGSGPRAPSELRPWLRVGPGPSSGLGPRTGSGPRAPSELRPWWSWQKERWEAHKEEAFSSDHTDPLDQTIEEVIQVCCYGVSSTPCQQEETESFHISPPLSLGTQSDDWDSPVQVVLQRGQTLSDTPVQVNQTEGQDLSHLMDVQVNLEDQVYSYQLDSALHSEQRVGGGARQDKGFWNLPIEEVLPAPEHIPESFRGKTWAQVEQEDEQKVDKLVRQFRRGRFICYFDSESLARYGRRSQNRKGHGENNGAGSDTGVLPLLDQDEGDSVCVRRRRRSFRVASRCQVVKVSHSTQTVRVVVPAVRQPEAPPTGVAPAYQDVAERTPDMQSWRCLPPSYSNIITPLQPRTSLVYLLCSPTGPASTCTPPPGSTPKRCRKKRRPLDLQGLKVKYKRLPVKFYDLSSNRILKNAPKGFLWRRGSASSTPPPPCVRQLFRSLSPDLNTEKLPGEGGSGPSVVKSQRSSDSFSHTNGRHFILGTLRRDSAQTDKQDTVRRRGRTSQAPPPPPPPPPPTRSEQGRGGRRERTRPPPPKRRSRTQATPPQPRREGLRRTGTSLLPPPQAHPPSPRRGRGRRGRACEKSRR
ncbi:DBF4-type zinc finger-containing protein 2 [Thunnus thynnus]|uniref:DBF4-type zinc finger-containing protein 2 n=1 Tax=Thunnus thynnus TaxID=8237 RepID=UPI003527F8A1